MDAFFHRTVLLEETISLLAPRGGGVYCDATLGGAGHAIRILDASAPDGRLVGVDRDDDALAAARERLAPYGSRVTLLHGAFGDLPELLAEAGITALDGILVDLGVSSPQLDRGERGFSFTKEGPLDMRMDPTRGETALALVRRLDIDALADILREYGEERYAGRVARAVKEAVVDGGVTTTTALARVIAKAMPPVHPAKREKIDPATRTFQALRIAVNGELDQLATLLEVFPDLLAPGGRFVAISFHSLEDRLVKERIRELAWTSSMPDDLAVKMGERTVPICRPLTKKPITAGEAELAVNARSRSAKLRACEKVAA